MPIYEFHCKKCNTIYRFFSRTVDTETRPKCPKCKKPNLERMFSTFSTISSRKDEGGDQLDIPDLDERKLERAMAMLEKEVDGIDEDDPRQAANLMRKLSDAAGISWGAGMEEALSRLESGEDPETIEEEMGDLLDEGDIFDIKKKARKVLKAARSDEPDVDDTLYEM